MNWLNKSTDKASEIHQREGMSTVTIQTQIQKIAALVLSDIQNVENDIHAVLSKPAIAPFVPLIETTIKEVLTANGIPVDKLDTALTQLLSVLSSLLQAAATVSEATNTNTNTNTTN